MISDILAVALIALMSVLVVYPSTRAVQHVLEARHRRQAPKGTVRRNRV